MTVSFRSIPHRPNVVSPIVNLAFFLVIVVPSVCGNYWNLLSSDRHSQTRCVDIPKNFTLCHGIQYNSMRLPNLLDHESLNEAISESEAWISLLKLHCHPDAKLFLCSIFAPICLPNMDKHIYPCQSLCNVVQKGCEGRMKQYGFPWPEMLRCNKYPEDNDMCIKPVDSGKPKPNAACKSCSQVATFENILDNYCRSTVVLKARLHSNGSHITIRKSRSFKGTPTGNHRRGSIPPGGGKRSVSFHNQVIRFSDVDDSNGNCPCSVVGKGNFLVMANEGRRSGNELVAQLILPWRKEKVCLGTNNRLLHKSV
jgi:secreted frizzled-related protein 5